MIKAVIFDADGVVINAERFSVQLEREYGISADSVLPFFTGVFQECLIGKADLKEVITPHLAEWGWKGTVDELLTFWFASEHKIDQEIITSISSIKEKTHVFMATNQEQCRVNYMISERGFGELFEKVYSSASIGHLKANPDFFIKMIEDIRANFIPELTAEEVLFFDDSIENVEGAKKAGVDGVLFSDLNSFKEKIKQLGL